MSIKLGKDIVTRLATLKDIDDIKKYRNGIEPDTPYMGNPSKDKLKERLIECIKDKNKFYYVIIKQKTIVGMFIYTVDKTKEVVKVDHISIDKKMYGTGLSNMLMELAEEEANKNRISTLELVVHKDNVRGIKFYEKIGYKQVKAVRHILIYRKEIELKKFSLEDW